MKLVRPIVKQYVGVSLVIGLFLGASCLSISCSHGGTEPIRPDTAETVEPYVPDYKLDRFESQIKTFEKKDSIAPPAKNKFLFIGSSTFAFWTTLDKDLAPLPVLNRGFGGSTIPELIYYANRIVFPYQPRAVVVYAGDNELVTEKVKTPEQVAESYKDFVKLIRQRLASIPIYYISIKPSPKRWSKWADMQRTNQLIQQYTKTDSHLSYIDITAVMLNASGRPKPELYRSDSLHMTEKGYQAWVSVIKPILSKN